MGGSPSKVKDILQRIEQGISETMADVRACIKKHAEFKEIGARMVVECEKGIALSLPPGS